MNIDKRYDFKKLKKFARYQILPATRSKPDFDEKLIVVA